MSGGLTQLANGLAGAIGCDYRPSTHRLLFVEYSGNISVLYLIRPAAGIVSSGSGTLHGTWEFSLDTGTEGSGDIWWEQETTTLRQMVPLKDAQIVNLGAVDYDALTEAELQGLTYATTPIPGNDDSSNQLTDGDVFAVRTNGGNYAKVQVVNYGYDLQIRWDTYELEPAYQVLGTGYSELEDIVVSSDETHAWISERGGNIYNVDLTSADRGSPTTSIIASGFTAPQQIAVDEARNFAYLVEYSSPGRLIRIDLTTNTPTTLVPDLDNPVGLAITSDATSAYVTEQASGGGQLSRIDLASRRRSLLTSGLTAPFFLTWAGPAQDALFTTLRDPANQVVRMALTGSSVTVSTVLDPTAFRPSSVAVVTPTDMLVCCDSEIDEADLSPFAADGPTLLGIGLIPADKIIGGLATTDPGYFYEVTNAPFGGALNLMVNHTGAFGAGAAYYSVEVDGMPQIQPFNDYLWTPVDLAFDLTPTAPTNGVFYPVRTPAQLWYNAWLGYILDSSPMSNGMHSISVRLFADANYATEIGSTGDPGRSVDLIINQNLPRAIIDNVFHGGSAVPACSIVHTAGDTAFSFQITADQPDGYLASWGLSALWGDNKSGGVASETYAPPPAAWSGLTDANVPTTPWDAAVSGDPSSTNCAHTFILGVWDRTTNGYGSIHYVQAARSITIESP